MFNWHVLSILNGLDVIRLFYLAGISLLEATFWGFWGKMTPKTSNERKTLAESALSYAKLRLLSYFAWNYLYHLACAGAQETKKAGRKSQEVYISRMCGATPSGRIPTKLGTCVCIPNVIKHATFHRYILIGFRAVMCWSFHVAIGNPVRPYHSAKRYRAAGDKAIRSWMTVQFLC